MTRLYVVVEGWSEESFVNKLLVPHFSLRGVGMHAMKVLLPGGGRGGGSNWSAWARHLRNLMRQHDGPDMRFSTMLDLYRIPSDTPGWTAPGASSGPIRADALLAGIRTQFPDRRFIPYIQVHEFETLLFVNLPELQRIAPDVVEPRRFRGLVRDVAGVEPEDVNDGSTTAPSKRITACTSGFQKTIHGVQATENIGLPELRRQCPRFHAWITALELAC
jgi:hypothetical protein